MRPGSRDGVPAVKGRRRVARVKADDEDDRDLTVEQTWVVRAFASLSILEEDVELRR